RVLCAPGTSFDQVLDEVNYVLRQSGNLALANVLHQRTSPRSKIAVLFQALRSSPLLLWLDDFDKLLASAAEAQIETRSVEYFLEGLETLKGCESRIVIVSQERPRSGSFHELAVGAFSPDLADLYWKQLRKGAPLPWRGALPALPRTP